MTLSRYVRLISFAPKLAITTTKAIGHVAPYGTQTFGGVSKRIAFGQRSAHQSEGDNRYQTNHQCRKQPSHE